MDQEHRTEGPARVLVVEDDPLLREIVSEELKERGFEVEQAADGSHALRLLDQVARPPDVILLDLMMPVMNGWQFREAQLEDPRFAAIPVVVVSAQDTFGISADAKLSKPFDVDDLMRALDRLARREGNNRDLSARSPGRSGLSRSPD